MNALRKTASVISLAPFAAVVAALAAACSAPAEEAVASAGEAALGRAPDVVTRAWVETEDPVKLGATIENPSGRDVLCKRVVVTSRAAKNLDCANAAVDVDPVVLTEVRLAPGETKAYRGATALGGAELARTEAVTGKAPLSFCSAETTRVPADCGYACFAGGARKDYGETWGERVVNDTGKVWSECDADGEVRTKGYCKIVDGEKMEIEGRPWTERPDPNGHFVLHRTCKAGGVVFDERTCDANYELLSDNTCRAVGCGGVPHGGDVVEPITGGTITRTCDFGNRTNPRVTCAPSWNPSGLECLPPKGCVDLRGPGIQRAHGERWDVSQCTSRGEYLQTFTCDNGAVRPGAGRFTGRLTCGGADERL